MADNSCMIDLPLVDYAKKDLAKKFGATWDKGAKMWKVDGSRHDISAFIDNNLLDPNMPIGPDIKWGNSNPTLNQLCREESLPINVVYDFLKENGYLGGMNGSYVETLEGRKVGFHAHPYELTNDKGTVLRVAMRLSNNAVDYIKSLSHERFAEFDAFASNKKYDGLRDKAMQAYAKLRRDILRPEGTVSTSDVDVEQYNFASIPDADKLVVLDTETTGFSGKDEVYELAILKIDGDVLYHQRFEPNIPLTYGASRVTFMTDDELVGYPKFSEEYDDICSVLQGKILVGHNLDYDKRALKATANKHGCDGEGIGSYFDGCLDTMKLCKAAYGYADNKLESLVNGFGLRNGPQEHSAVSDCKDTIRLMQHIDKDLTSGKISKDILSPKSKKTKAQVAEAKLALVFEGRDLFTGFDDGFGK